MLSIEYCSSRCFYICYVTLILPRLFQSYTYHCRRNVRMERRSNLQIALSFRLGNSMIHFRWAREDIFLGEKKKREAWKKNQSKIELLWFCFITLYKIFFFQNHHFRHFLISKRISNFGNLISQKKKEKKEKEVSIRFLREFVIRAHK